MRRLRQLRLCLCLCLGCKGGYCWSSMPNGGARECVTALGQTSLSRTFEYETADSCASERGEYRCNTVHQVIKIDETPASCCLSSTAAKTYSVLPGSLAGQVGEVILQTFSHHTLGRLTYADHHTASSPSHSPTTSSSRQPSLLLNTFLAPIDARLINILIFTAPLTSMGPSYAARRPAYPVQQKLAAHQHQHSRPKPAGAVAPCAHPSSVPCSLQGCCCCTSAAQRQSQQRPRPQRQSRL